MVYYVEKNKDFYSCFCVSVIKGKVLNVAEEGVILTYVVEVVQIIQEGEELLKTRRIKPVNTFLTVVDLVQREACKSPKLEENKEYLFMGLDRGGRYELDQSSFVKWWPTDQGNSDKKQLDNFAIDHYCQSK